jgi:glyoxylase-like metal-dependent hydrolase (beta-lactamase superfamily II)
VRPVVEAGQSRIIPIPHNVAAGLSLEAAPGHTTGHSVLRLVSDGAAAYFTGDAFHHPLQLTRPELHLPGCDDLEVAITTRKLLVRRLLDEDAWVFPAHFPAPHYGRLAMDGAEVIFLAGGAESPSR